MPTDIEQSFDHGWGRWGCARGGYRCRCRCADPRGRGNREREEQDDQTGPWDYGHRHLQVAVAGARRERLGCRAALLIHFHHVSDLLITQGQIVRFPGVRLHLFNERALVLIPQLLAA